MKQQGPYNIQPLFGFALVTGGSADTDLTCAGIKKEDTVVMALELAATSNDPTDRTSVASLVTDGKIQFSVATTGDKILVLWQKYR